MAGLAHRTSPAARAAIAIAVMVGLLAAAWAFLGEGVYLWVKAAHVIAVIAWMAGMLYLPRLFIYHCEAPPGSPQSETFKVMERRLLTVIINPAMVLTWVLGLWLAWQGGFFTAGWLHAKLALVLAMSGVHGFFSASVRRFAADANTTSQRAWRLWNEVPTVLLIGIVILVIVKPF
jgi:protoporphyrinogen IX oxidase